MHEIRRRAPIGAWMALILVLLVGYPLSVGPASWLDAQTNNPALRRGLELFYAPLGFLVQANDSLGYMAAWHIELWT